MSAIVDIAAFSAQISDRTVWTFVRARDASGRSGWGEATLQGEAASVHAQVARFAPAFIGRPPTLPVDAAAAIGIRDRTMAEAAAISAMDQSFHDLAGQERGRSLAAVLGSQRRATIGLYANINRGTVDRRPSGFAARAQEATARGFDAVKIAPFDDIQPDSVGSATGRRLLALGAERVAAVREAIGPRCRLLVDCHWRLTEGAASDMLRELEPARLYWLECPLVEQPSMFPALRRLRSQANDRGVRLAGCESMTGLSAFQSFLDAGVYDVVMPDVKYAGGLVEVLRIGDAAAATGVACSPHNPSGPIAHTHSVHVSALLPDFPFLEIQYEESPLFFDIVDGKLPDPRHGTATLPSAHGLGVGLDIARLPPPLAGIRAPLQGAARS